MTTLGLTAEDYTRAFRLECARAYPMIDVFEARCGHALERGLLESAARVLACPVKAHAPHWQHGRVLYSAARQSFERGDGGVTILDIGSAKGFSALCLLWALMDAGLTGAVISVDVIDPLARVARNTVAECDGLKTLAETLAPWSDAGTITFEQSTGIAWLEQHPARVHVAFVDGKHSGHVVRREGVLLTARQQAGDLAVFDDVHIPDVSQAVVSLQPDYRFEYLEPLPHRHYAIGVRR